MVEDDDGKKIRSDEERAEKAFKSATTRKTAEQVYSVFRSTSSRFTPPTQRTSSGFSFWCGQRDRLNLFSCSSVDCPLRPGNCFACGRFGHWRSECNQIARSGVTRGNLDSRWLKNSFLDEQSKCDISVINPFSDLENRSWQGLVQDSENYEVESPGNSGCYDSVIPLVSVKGKLSKLIAFWHSIGAPDFILSVIRDGYKIPFISTPPPHHSKNNSFALKELGFVTEAISELLSDNRAEEIFSPPDIINPLSVSVQANGKKRLILDLRHINLHIFKQKFKC